MPTFRHGKNTKVFINEFDLSTQLREVNTTAEADTAETSAFGTTDKTYVIGLLGTSLTLSGMFSGAAGEIDALFNSWNGDDIDKVVSIYTEGVGAAGSGTGRAVQQAPGKFTMRTIPSTLTDMVGIQANIISDGIARSGRSLHDYVTAESSTGNMASGLDNGVLTSNGGSGHLNVPINTRNGTSIIKVQHSTDNSAWADLVTFATVNASTITSERIVVAPLTTVNRYLRGQWTIAGTTGAITFALSFARH